MKLEKKEPQRNRKAIYTFRILGGGYLVYLSYSMLKGWAEVPDKSRLFIGAFMVIFAIVGAILVITSLIQYTKVKNEPAEIDDIMEESEEPEDMDQEKQQEDTVVESLSQTENENMEDNSKNQ